MQFYCSTHKQQNFIFRFVPPPLLHFFISSCKSHQFEISHCVLMTVSDWRFYEETGVFLSSSASHTPGFRLDWLPVWGKVSSVSFIRFPCVCLLKFLKTLCNFAATITNRTQERANVLVSQLTDELRWAPRPSQRKRKRDQRWIWVMELSRRPRPKSHADEKPSWAEWCPDAAALSQSGSCISIVQSSDTDCIKYSRLLPLINGYSNHWWKLKIWKTTILLIFYYSVT